MADRQHVASRFGGLADDFFVSIVLLKSLDPVNLCLPFLHGHVLELSAKAACHKRGVNVDDINHDVLKIYKRLEPHLPSIAPWIPTPAHLADHEKTYVREGSPHHDVALPIERTAPPITIKPGEGAVVWLPDKTAVDEMAALELAYIVSNVMDLKYGFTKKNLLQVSGMHIASRELNHRFLALFRACRDAYADADMNLRVKSNLLRLGGATSENQQRVREYLGI